MGVMALGSNFNFEENQITSGDYIKFFMVVMLFGDAFLEQLLKVPKKWNLFKPISKPYGSMSSYFNGNYLLYLEIPLWTTIYPIVRWIF